MNSIAVPTPLATALADLARGSNRAAARGLSDRYRAGASSVERPVVRDDAELAAYAVARFPATYAAAVAAFSAAATADPTFTPASMLDVGSGLGATTAAAIAVWPSITAVTCVESDPRAAAAGREIVAALDVATHWVVTSATGGLPGGPADLVCAGYVGNELADPTGFAGTLWEATTGLLVLVEPGTHPASHALLAGRDAVLALGGTTLAPCPHDDRCPLPRSDWCHFGQRLPRTAAHRQLKGGELAYEDEKYSYVALSRTPVTERASRVIRRPVRRKNLVELPLCTPTGTRLERVPKSDPRYRDAKDAGWGAPWPTSTP